MSSISAARGVIDDVALAVQRTLDSEGALARLVGDASAARDVTRAVRSGPSWHASFGVVDELAARGSQDLHGAWTNAEEAATILSRVVERHPGIDGYAQLLGAREAAVQASGDLGNWIARGGRDPLESLQAVVRPQLERVRAMAALVTDP